VCAECARRSWLLGELAPALDRRCHDREALLSLLALEDRGLIQALGGRRRGELAEQYERWTPKPLDGEALCRHDPRFPRALSDERCPCMLTVAGTCARLERLVAAPVVAVVGATKASDYGVETARMLARGLAVSGVTVAAPLADGIAGAAHAGALEAGGGTIAVVGAGLGVTPPSRLRALYGRAVRLGCAVSEIPAHGSPRLWSQLACERTVAAVSGLTVVVEAEEKDRDLACARLARAFERAVAAVPGRVNSPLSAGTNGLLLDGAHVVRGASDMLELLYRLGAAGAAPQGPDRVKRRRLPPRLRDVLDRVGNGFDTPDRLIAAGGDATALLTALSELELMGLVARGVGGRYVACGVTPERNVLATTKWLGAPRRGP
jgi:DNA processing protein